MHGLIHNSGSNHQLLQERIERLERAEMALSGHHKPASPSDTLLTTKHPVPVKQASQSSRSSDYSYKQLWKLRTTLEDDDYGEGVRT